MSIAAMSSPSWSFQACAEVASVRWSWEESCAIVSFDGVVELVMAESGVEVGGGGGCGGGGGA